MGSTSKKPRVHYHPERRRVKKTHKVESLLRQYQTLQKRLETEGETTWLKNAKKQLLVRIKRAGLTLPV